MLRRTIIIISLFLSSAHAQIDPTQFPSAPPRIVEQPVMEITVMLGGKIDVGVTDDGHRYIVPITGGFFTGNEIKGTVIPGGADWQVDRLDKVKNIEAIYALNTNDGETIVINNKGLVHKLHGERYAMTRIEFHAPKGKYEWLNQSMFLSTITSIQSPRSVIIRVYNVASQ